MACSIVPFELYEDCFVEVEASPKIQLRCRLWGNRTSGVPVLFVHGGPGNNVVTYDGVNKHIFDISTFFVVEVDQRGCGKSQPSVLDPSNGVANMQLYRGISMPQMSADFEVVRKKLGIDKWLVFGGSWGSTLGLDYAIRFPDRCLGLIVRGIFLGTPQEHDEVYARKTFAGCDTDVRRFQLKQFDTFYEYAKKEVERRQETPLDPDDSERLCRVYEDLILQGDRMAAWMCFAYEENLMSEGADLLDYDNIDEEAFYAEGVSTAFFEMRLFLRLAFEEPANLMSRLGALANVKTWVVQGTGDAVCPDYIARELVAGLEKANVAHKAYFVDANHKSSSKNIKKALQQSVAEFAEEFAGVVSMKVTTKKSSGFYESCAKTFFKGSKDKEGNQKQPVSQLKISGLDGSINVAVAAALAVQGEGLATIIKIDTAYPEMEDSQRPCSRICITLNKK